MSLSSWEREAAAPLAPRIAFLAASRACLEKRAVALQRVARRLLFAPPQPFLTPLQADAIGPLRSRPASTLLKDAGPSLQGPCCCRPCRVAQGCRCPRHGYPGERRAWAQLLKIWTMRMCFRANGRRRGTSGAGARTETGLRAAPSSATAALLVGNRAFACCIPPIAVKRWSLKDGPWIAVLLAEAAAKL